MKHYLQAKRLGTDPIKFAYVLNTPEKSLPVREAFEYVGREDELIREQEELDKKN